MGKRTIMFCFGGRQANLELQLPFIRRILSERPGVEYHLWNLAKNHSDAEYIRELRKNARIKVIDDFYGPDPWTRFNDVYRHYASPEFKHCRFVKLDDDIVFIQTHLFSDFIDAIDANPDSVISANVINNGACMRLDNVMLDRFKSMRMRLLDVHRFPGFAQMSHEYFFDNWRQIVGREMHWVSTPDWLSINFIGYNHDMARKFPTILDTPSPPVIAGRHFRGRDKVGDEGMVNMLPRIITDGFTVAHLTFGPQERKDPFMFADFRKRYAEIGKEYLSK